MLPPELWREICRGLPSSDLKSLLFVSRLTHQLALELLFRTVNLYLVPKILTDELQGHHHSTVNQVVNHAQHAHKLSEVIIRIGNDFQFARLIRTLRVHAMRCDSLFELLLLAHTITLLPSLQTLHWFHSTLPDEIAQSLPKTLQVLHIPSVESFASLTHLRELREVHLVQALPRFRFGLATLVIPNADTNAHEILDFLKNQLSTLVKLALLPHHLERVPLRSYDQLTELEIYYVYSDSGSSGLDLIFRHAPNLMALALTGCVPLDYFPAFGSKPNALPSLRSLCIVHFETYSASAEMVQMLGRFIKAHPGLTRIFFDGFRTPWDLIIDHLAPSFGSSEQLTTLGFESECFIDDKMIPLLCRALPGCLQALHLSWTVNKRAADAIQNAIHPIVAELARFRRLSFLSASSPNEYLPYSEVASLVGDMNLQTVALDGRLWDITRSAEGEVTATQWSDAQVESCVPETWFCEDDYWLLRYAGEPLDKVYV